MPCQSSTLHLESHNLHSSDAMHHGEDATATINPRPSILERKGSLHLKARCSSPFLERGMGIIVYGRDILQRMDPTNQCTQLKNNTPPTILTHLNSSPPPTTSSLKPSPHSRHHNTTHTAPTTQHLQHLPHWHTNTIQHNVTQHPSPLPTYIHRPQNPTLESRDTPRSLSVRVYKTPPTLQSPILTAQKQTIWKNSSPILHLPFYIPTLYHISYLIISPHLLPPSPRPLHPSITTTQGTTQRMNKWMQNPSVYTRKRKKEYITKVTSTNSKYVYSTNPESSILKSEACLLLIVENFLFIYTSIYLYIYISFIQTNK